MSKYRRAARVDNNQSKIVKLLEQIPGVTVAVNHDDILVGYKKQTYWYEVKNESAASKKTGKVFESKIQPSQKKLQREWTGHYRIVTNANEILEELGVCLN